MNPLCSPNQTWKSDEQQNLTAGKQSQANHQNKQLHCNNKDA